MSRERNKVLKKEKFMWLFIMLILFLYPLLNVITSAKLSETNIEVEILKYEIEDQNKKNESINMQINELSSLEKIREIAGENGLTYKNNNITAIDKEN